LKELEHELQVNSKIPVGVTCTDEEAVVEINETMEPMCKQPYGIPHSMTPNCKWNWPLICAPKKNANGRWTEVRVCVDFRTLNNSIKDEQFTIPLIADLLQATAGFKIASTIDLKGWKHCRFQFVGAPFGLKHLPKHAQRVLTRVLAKHARYCKIFIDDIIIFSSLIEEHVHHLRTVLRSLGYVTDGSSIQIDPSKADALINMPAPTSFKELRSVLGLANYLREFIPKYSKVVAPMEAIKWRRTKFETTWNEECEKAFEELSLWLLMHQTKALEQCCSKRLWMENDGTSCLLRRR